MSDHRGTPEASPAASAPTGGPVPVPAHEPPYYVVVFTAVPAEDREGYGKTAEQLEELVKEVPGYLGMDQATAPGGLSITVGYFRDLAAIEEWRSYPEHRAAQKRGRAQWYESYALHIAKVERSHAFDRGTAAPPR
ncbi:antibiotic biosynthesis monooxygenase family protein [Streptomyces sp. NPDC002573]|uniref:antibiotic biosynthesis monooxygenase family protein n=1 Tax=Streptomyces sp. NPDC002573 TaxID=3364651 RepID=UPI0036C9CA3C